jgi:hypothetical protein
MPKGKYGSKHSGKGVSRQMANSSGSGRRRSGGTVSDGGKGATSIQSTDRSNGRFRPTAPKYGK